MGQDAKTVIANAQKALGDVKSITYSGTAKDVSFQQCGANSTDMTCRGTHDPMRPINNYVRVIDLTTSTSRHTGATNNIGGGGSTTAAQGNFLAQVRTPQPIPPGRGKAPLEFTSRPGGSLKAALDPTALARGPRVEAR